MVEDPSSRFLLPFPHYPPQRHSVSYPYLRILSNYSLQGKMNSVIRLFSLALVLALAGTSVNAYAIPRASVDYRRHDVNVRIVEETTSIPSLASPPRFNPLRRGVRDFRFPAPLRTRRTLRRPDLDDFPDVVPGIPREGRGSIHHHTVPSPSTLSSRNRVAPRDLAFSYTEDIPAVLPRNAAGLVQLDLFNTYFQQMHANSRNLRESPLSAHTLYLTHRFSLGDYSGRARDSRNDPRFRDDTARELRGFRDNMGRTRGLLGDLGREKGLANYDRNNDLETFLKEIVNLNKDTLSSVDDLVYKIPALGPTLGPSKCLSDPTYILAGSFLCCQLLAKSSASLTIPSTPWRTWWMVSSMVLVSLVNGEASVATTPTHSAEETCRSSDFV